MSSGVAADSMCADTESAVSSFLQHGFCVVSPSLTNLDPGVLVNMQHWCEQYKPKSASAYREDSELRYTMNQCDNILFPEWQQLIKELLQDGDSNFVYLMNGIIVSAVAVHQRWYLECCGGDAVLSSGPGQEMHSDWPGWGSYGYPSILIVSIFCTDMLDPDCAPLALVSKEVCKAHDRR